MGRVRVVVVCCVAAFLVVVGGVGLAADGVWSSPVDLSASGGVAYYPQVGLSSDGTHAMAVWMRASSFDWVVQSAAESVSGGISSWGG